MYRIWASESMKSGHFSQSQTPEAADLFLFDAGKKRILVRKKTPAIVPVFF
jgi:hypothetical protein